MTKTSFLINKGRLDHFGEEYKEVVVKDLLIKLIQSIPLEKLSNFLNSGVEINIYDPNDVDSINKKISYFKTCGNSTQLDIYINKINYLKNHECVEVEIFHSYEEPSKESREAKPKHRPIQGECLATGKIAKECEHNDIDMNCYNKQKCIHKSIG